MAKDEDKLTKKEQEYLDVLNRDGQVIIEEDGKSLEKLAKELEKIYGKCDPPVVG